MFLLFIIYCPDPDIIDIYLKKIKINVSFDT